MYADTTQHLGELGFGLKTIAKGIQKATSKGPLKAVKKVLRKAGAVQAGLITAGLVKPKALHIYNKKSRKLYKISGNTAKVAAVVAGGVLLAPAVGPAAGAALGAAKNFLTGSGIVGDTAQALAQGMVAGQIPAPTPLANQLQGQYGMSTASMLTSPTFLVPIVLLGGVVVYSVVAKKRR